jgi:hypothetical protein
MTVDLKRECGTYAEYIALVQDSALMISLFLNYLDGGYLDGDG